MTKFVLNNLHRQKSTGYIAGIGHGIVTVAGLPVSRVVILLDASNLKILDICVSLKIGHYLFMGLDPAKRYLIMVRDLPPQGNEQRYEPYCYDYVTPATDLTVTEQQALWESWQT